MGGQDQDQDHGRLERFHLDQYRRMAGCLGTRQALRIRVRVRVRVRVRMRSISPENCPH